MRTKGVLITRDQLLDAAELAIVEDGIGRLTMDAVARRAGVSKGAVVYHFGSMDALVDALVARIASAWDREYAEQIALTPPGPGSVARTFLRYCMSGVETWPTSLRRTSAVMIAAAAHASGSLDPIRAVFTKYSDLADADGLPPGVGRAVVAAVDGIWWYWMMDLMPLPSARVDEMRHALERMLQDACRPKRKP
jgi:AcrR family transcriptional regulator